MCDLCFPNAYMFAPPIVCRYRLLVKGRAAAQERHYGLFLYFLKDIDDQLHDTSFAAAFASAFGISTAVVDTITLFWNVDRGHILADRDPALLNFVLSDSVLIKKQDAAVLHAICHRRHPDKALELLQVRVSGLFTALHFELSVPPRATPTKPRSPYWPCALLTCFLVLRQPDQANFVWWG